MADERVRNTNSGIQQRSHRRRLTTIGGVQRLVIAAAAGILLVGGTIAPAEGIDRGSMGEMSPKKTHIRMDFPPIGGVYSHAGAFATYRPFGCAAYNYCDRVTFDMQFPDRYAESFRGTEIVGFGVRISLTWEDPENNDVDLFVWPDDSPTSGGPQGPCTTANDEECSETHPETFSVVDPVKAENDPETKEDETKLPVTIFMSVVNNTGVNTGYRIDLQWFLIPLGSLPDFEPPKGGAVSRRPVTASRTPQPFDLDRARKAGGDEPGTKILIPGPDGKLVEQELFFYEAGHRFAPARESTASWVWAAVAVIAAVAVLVFAFLVIRRRRREAVV